MWLTQTYLVAPGRQFPAYAYLLFNPYTDWASDVLRSIRSGLSTLGRQTEGRMAILMPDQAIDSHQVGKELNHRFRPLVDKIVGRGSMKSGILISDVPLEEMDSDGVNARWVYCGFDGFIEGGTLDTDFPELMTRLGACANSQQPEDIISRIVAALMSSDAQARRSRLTKALTASASLSGPSFGIRPGDLIDIFRRKGRVVTNIL